MTDYVVLHALMRRQQQTRRETGRPLQPGDLVQAHTGGEIRQVLAIASAGDCLTAVAIERAFRARETRRL